MSATLTLEAIAEKLQAIEREILTVDSGPTYDDDDEEDEDVEVISKRGRELLDGLIRDVDQALIAQKIATTASQATTQQGT